MQADALFMPRKKARLEDDGGGSGENAKRRKREDVIQMPNGRTVVFVNSEEDNDRERRKKMLLERKQRINTHFDFMEESQSVMNIMVICHLGCTLYLEPRTVVQYCSYWMSEYASRSTSPSEWFGGIVRDLLTTLPMLEISCQVGLRYTLDDSAFYPLLVRFAGSEMHRVPHAYFTARDTPNSALLKGLAYVIDPKNRCFLSSHTVGMMSEFFLESFVYNTLLEEFYEPSFLVMTCFMLYVSYVNSSLLANVIHEKPVTQANIRAISDDLNQLKIDLIERALKDIKLFVESTVDAASEEKDVRELDKSRLLRECGFVDRNDATGETKSMRMLRDLVEMIIMAEENILSPNKLQSELNEMWAVKMRYCCSEMSVRTSNILSPLLDAHRNAH